jgi:hypothetical protein
MHCSLTKLSVSSRQGEVSNIVIDRFSATALDIGMDLRAVASPAYHDREPFAFTGKIKEVARAAADSEMNETEQGGP